MPIREKASRNSLVILGQRLWSRFVSLERLGARSRLSLSNITLT
jgi:hypothetical protein